MHTFKQFLTEDIIVEAKDIPHVEDLPHLNGNEGVAQAANILDDLHTQLQGKTKAHFTATKAKTFVTQHFDGLPVVFGRHPTTKQFFVATDPKQPNFTHDDIRKNYGNQWHLANRMHKALAHLPSLAPKRGVYQGDILYDDDTVAYGKTVHEFKPNAVTYKVDARSEDGKKVRNSRLGIVVHTKFDNGMQPSPEVDYDKFQKPEDIHLIPHTVTPNPELYTTKHRLQFTNHMENAKLKYGKMKPDTLDVLNQHAEYFDHYINHAIRAGGPPDVEDYIKHLGNLGQKEGVKGDKSKAYQKYANLAQHAQSHKSELKSALDMHHDLQQAKNTLIDALAKNRLGWEYYVNGKRLPGPQSFIVHREGEQVKLENRKTHEKIHKETKKMLRGQR